MFEQLPTVTQCNIDMCTYLLHLKIQVIWRQSAYNNCRSN